MTELEISINKFSITIEPSGRNFSANANESILLAGIREGIGLPYGCKDGACGSCKSRLLSGEVTHGPHQDKALSTEEEAQGMILTCCGTAQSDLVIESRQVMQEGAFTVKKMPSRVSLLEKRSGDVMLLKLQLPANDTFAYHAGQYVEFILRDGHRRSYSMANSPDQRAASGGALELHIRHMPGGKFTDTVFSTLKEKDILRIEGPYGSFYLREDSTKPIVMLASGTGFAPIKALLEHIRFKGIERQTFVYWGGRRPDDLYMQSWMEAVSEEMPFVKYIPVVSDSLPEDQWSGRTGFVHEAVLQDLPDLSTYQVYACGAPIVVDSARASYTSKAGLPLDEFFSDSFTSEADKAQPLTTI